jgi:hypothetical protein
MKQAHEAVRSRFGRAFIGRYGWASEGPNDDINGFADVEKKVSLDHLRPYYKLASINVHANPKGVLCRLGLASGQNMLLLGPSNYGLADPGQNTALSLLQVSTELGTLQTTLDSIVVLKIMQTLYGEIGEAFVAVQRQIEVEEEHIQESEKRLASSTVNEFHERAHR